MLPDFMYGTKIWGGDLKEISSKSLWAWPCGRHHGVYPVGKLMTTQSHQEQYMMISRRFSLLKSGVFSSSLGRNYYLHLKDFLKYELCLKQPLTPPQRKINDAYRILNYRLAIEIRQWPITPISRDTKLCHFFSYNAASQTFGQLVYV